MTTILNKNYNYYKAIIFLVIALTAQSCATQKKSYAEMSPQEHREYVAKQASFTSSLLLPTPKPKPKPKKPPQTSSFSWSDAAAIATGVTSAINESTQEYKRSRTSINNQYSSNKYQNQSRISNNINTTNNSVSPRCTKNISRLDLSCAQISHPASRANQCESLYRSESREVFLACVPKCEAKLSTLVTSACSENRTKSPICKTGAPCAIRE